MVFLFDVFSVFGAMKKGARNVVGFLGKFRDMI